MSGVESSVQWAGPRMWILAVILTLLMSGTGLPHLPALGVGVGLGPGVGVGVGVGFGVGVGIAGSGIVRTEPLVPLGWVGSSSVMVWQPTRRVATAAVATTVFLMRRPL